MKTSRVLSNITWNTPAYFERVAKELVDNGVFDWCHWIVHQPDTDDTKQHIHFVFKPSYRLDTVDIVKAFSEYDPTNPSLPIKPTSMFNPTGHIDEWILYGLHNEPYLQSLGQHRNVHYTHSDFCSTDHSAFQSVWNTVNWRKYNRSQAVEKKVLEGATVLDLLRDGDIPVAQLNQWTQFVNMVRSDAVGKRKTKVAELRADEDGEIVPPWLLAEKAAAKRHADLYAEPCPFDQISLYENAPTSEC